MRTTSPRPARHAQVAPSPATGAAEAKRGVAGSHRRRWIQLLLIVPSVTALLAAAGLYGMHVTARPIHVTADTSQQHAGKSTGSALSVAGTCCFYSGIASPPASPSASPSHHAARKVRPRPSEAASPSSPASPSRAAGTGGDGSSWPTSVPGWQLTYSTDFPGSSLPSGWLAYNGEPGGDPDGNWDPANVTVSGGALNLLATPSAQGGVQFYGNPQTYGMYLVRMKGDYEPDLAINNLAILWPAQQGVWPPEVDFYQDLGGTRQNFSASLHPGPDGDGGCCVVASPTQDVNATGWHTYGVQWTPSSLTYTVDGQVWASVSSSSLSSGQWPTIPMNLTLQSQNQGSAQPSGTIDTMSVAWVAEYSMNG